MADEATALLSSSDPIIKDKVERLNKLKDALDSHAITQAEYQELLDDALEYRMIDAAVVGLERQIKLKEAFNALRTIFEIASSLRP